MLLGGEPGSGKSRLVRELATEAERDGVLVLTGACDAVVRTPYGPFVEALDQLARSAEPDELRTALGASGGELTRLLPDLHARIGELAPPVSADPDTERHRLHTTVATLLTGSATSRPCCSSSRTATGPTRRRSCCCATWRGRRAGPAAVLVTFRDAEADVPETLAEALADLRRSDTVIRMRVAGFSGEEVTEFIRSAAGGEVGAGPPWLAKAIGDLTGGNPFLVCELWRDLVETGMVELVGGRCG